MTINTATTITTAARRIARESGAYSLDREDLQFDTEGQIIACPWKSDRTAHDAIIATRKMTQREAQDMLDATRARRRGRCPRGRARQRLPRRCLPARLRRVHVEPGRGSRP